ERSKVTLLALNQPGQPRNLPCPDGAGRAHDEMGDFPSLGRRGSAQPLEILPDPARKKTQNLAFQDGIALRLKRELGEVYGDYRHGKDSLDGIMAGPGQRPIRPPAADS